MGRSLVLTLVLVACLVAAPAVRADGPPKPDDKKQATVGDLPLPPDSIIVICEKAADLLRAMPNGVLLPPAKYQELLDEIERLKRLAEAQKVASITKCAISGKVDGNRVELTLRFTFVTERDRAVVPLGCSLGQPTSITLDGKTPQTWNATDGLTIQVEKKGEHEAELRLELAVTPRTPSPLDKPADSATSPNPPVGFELDLPLSAITTLDLAVPAGAREFKLNDTAVQEPLVLKENQLAGPLNRPTRVKLTWRRPPVVQHEFSLLSVDGRIVVRMQPTQVSTDAELTLKPLGAPVDEWKLLVPASATVKLANAADEARLKGPIQGNDGKGTTRTITLKEPSSEPIVVLVEVRQPQRGAPVALGPFVVQGAARQRGSIFISAPADQRVRHRLPGKKGDPPPLAETNPRSPTDDERKQYPGLVLALSYWNLSAGEKSDERAPWLELEQEPIQGVLATRLTHNLKVTSAPQGSGMRWEWRLTTAIDGLPIRNGVEEMRLLWPSLPSPWRMDEERGPRPVDWTHPYRSAPEGNDVVTRFELPRNSLKAFQLTLEALPHRLADADAPGGDVQTALMALPRTQASRDRGNHLITITGAEDVDLSIAQPLNPPLELVTQEQGKIVWRAERMPTQVAVAWKPFRPELAVTSTVDVHLEGKQGTFTQKLRLLRPASAPRQILLRVPEAVADRIQVVRGGQVAGSMRLPGVPIARLRIDRPTGGDNGEIVLTGTFPLAADGARTVVPLAEPEQATQGGITARVWGEPGGRVGLVGEGGWHEAALEIVPEEDRLPVLVARTNKAESLALRYERPASALGRLVVERALVQVQVLDGGLQRYRVRMVLREPSSQPLDLQFPAPLATLDLQMTLDGKRLDTWDGLDDAGKVVGDSGRTARVRLAEARKASVLELNYQLVPGRTGGSGSLTSILQPANVPAVVAGVPTRWQIDLPEDWVPLPLEGAGATWKWGWRGWLLAPRPALDNRDLERWLAGDEAAEQLPPEYGEASSSLVCWRSDLTPLTIYHVPQSVCLLVSSLLVVVVGLLFVSGLTSPSRSRTDPGSVPVRVWVLVGVCALAVVLLGLFAPGLLAVLVFGGQPGLLVLFIVILVQWILYERQRRRLVYLPTFSRRPAGSSMVQGRPARPSNGSGEPIAGKRSSQKHPLPAREPSTVDAPAPPE